MIAWTNACFAQFYRDAATARDSTCRVFHRISMNDAAEKSAAVYVCHLVCVGSHDSRPSKASERQQRDDCDAVAKLKYRYDGSGNLTHGS